MDFAEALKKLKSDDSFLNWMESHKDAYLVHFFAQLDSHLRATKWDVGFYDSNSDRITTFSVGETIEEGSTDEVFKEKGTVLKLDVGAVKVSYDAAVRAAKGAQMETYSAQVPLRGFPALRSVAPKTSRPSRAATTAPAHMQHGSSVTYIVQPSSRQFPW